MCTFSMQTHMGIQIIIENVAWIQNRMVTNWKTNGRGQGLIEEGKGMAIHDNENFARENLHPPAMLVIALLTPKVWTLQLLCYSSLLYFHGWAHPSSFVKSVNIFNQVIVSSAGSSFKVISSANFPDITLSLVLYYTVIVIYTFSLREISTICNLCFHFSAISPLKVLICISVIWSVICCS